MARAVNATTCPPAPDPSAAQSTNPGTQTGYSHGSGIGPTFTSTSAAQHQLPPHSNDPYMMYNNNTYQQLRVVAIGVAVTLL